MPCGSGIKNTNVPVFQCSSSSPSSSTKQNKMNTAVSGKPVRVPGTQYNNNNT